jgi:2-C-methyl-D-erythritol 2,4-cyclodiphosphate synthase
MFLGGIEFPGEEGLLGHSDADVLIHALMDALLGAAGAPDIGRLFPDTDPTYRDVRSTELLRIVAARIEGLGWRIGNVDATLIAERPKISARVPEMQQAIAESLGVAPSQIGVKASTAEGLGFVGEGLGVECHAVALLVR